MGCHVAETAVWPEVVVLVTPEPDGFAQPERGEPIDGDAAVEMLRQRLLNLNHVA